MKSFLLSVWIVCASFVVCAAAGNPFEQGFAWQPSPSTNVPTYVLYHTTNGAALAFNPDNVMSDTNWNRIPVTNFTWMNLVAAITNHYAKTNFVAGVTNWVMMTARDLNGVESVPSNIITFVPPKPPSNLRLFIQVAPTINGPWQTVTNVPPVEIYTTNPVLFSRLFHKAL